MTNASAISIRNLSKAYAAGGGAPAKPALDDVSFEVPQGEIFGLLGPNGAGKSTLINILAGLVMKTAGEVDIWGFDIDRARRNASRAIGIVPQEIVFDPFFTPMKCWRTRRGFTVCPRRSAALPNCSPPCISRTRREPMPARCRGG